MVTVQKVYLHKSQSFSRRCIVQVFLVILIGVAFFVIHKRNKSSASLQHASVRVGSSALLSTLCPYATLNDLKQDELHPVAAATRHMVTPPSDTLLTLVCCRTTVGSLNILVHHAWAPKGAQRFVEMVRADYFNHPQEKVPLMRCIHKFICQFGLAGKASNQFQSTLSDDPNWLPKGKEFRENALGVKRFATGYLAYAGAGPNSRNNQFIVALNDNGRLAGGSPWEVPWGELVGEQSFQTLSKIYTGYGEKGPSQARLHQEGYVDYVNKEFPKLHWFDSCHVVDERTVA